MRESDSLEEAHARVSFWIRDLQSNRKRVTKKLGLDSRLRFEWRIRNESDDSIWIHGYYCPVYSNGNFRGVFDQKSNTFREDVFYISGERVQTFLRPEERRTYVWGWVFPSYYGIDAPGKWRFSLQFSYILRGSTLVTKPKSATVIIDETSKVNLDSFNRNRRMLLSDGVVVEMLAPHLGKLKPFLDSKSSYLFKAGALGRIDFLARTDSELVVIEMSAVADAQTLKQVKGYVDWVRTTFGHAFGSKVRAAIIAHEIHVREQDFSKLPYPVWIFRYLEAKKLELIYTPTS